MLRRVRIKAIPKARTGYQVQGSLMNDISAWGGGDYAEQSGIPEPRVNQSLTRVPREEANLEAEGGETAVVNTGNIPAFYNIKGPRHSEGGVPLNLPDESFIFSDTQSMKIKDPDALKRFGLKPKKGAYTPAEISKKYPINEYVKILRDPNSDKISKKTAELMIKNAVIKLGELALLQESMKGFEQGIPEIARPALAAMGVSEEDIMPAKPQEQAPPMQDMPPQGMPQQMPSGAPIATPEMMARYGMEMGSFYPEFAYGGFTKFAPGGNINPYEKAKTTQGNITPTGQQNKFSDRKQKLDEYLAQWKDAVPGIENMNEGQAQRAIYEWSLKNNPDAIRNMWSTYGLTAKGMKSDPLRALSQDRTGKFTTEMLQDPKVLQQLEDAYVDNYFGVRQLDPTKPQPKPEDTPEDTPEGTPDMTQETCTCPDPETGEPITRALMPGEKCDCPDGEEGETSTAAGMTPPRKRSGPWLQDVMDVTGAAIDEASINKYLPQRTDVDLVKPDLVTFDPTALYNQIAGGKYFGEFAGDPRQASARQSQMMGQMMEGMAGIGNQYNTMNQQAGQSHEYQTNAIENQERGMDAQAEQQYLDRSAIARNQYDNSKRQAKKIKREAKKNLLTNMTKTDALNQLYPNYQVDPSMGGWVNYTPTDKNVDPGKAQQDAIAFAQSLEAASLTPEMQAAIFNKTYSKYGGSTFKKGGFVYTVFPVVNL